MATTTTVVDAAAVAASIEEAKARAVVVGINIIVVGIVGIVVIFAVPATMLATLIPPAPAIGCFLHR
jgi:hypothetical protein